MSTSQSTGGAHWDHNDGPTERDQQIAAEAKQRARDQHNQLRSSISLTPAASLVDVGDEEQTIVVSDGNGMNRSLDVKIFNPPANFAQVVPGVYRSSFPKIANFDHLKSIQVKTILTLVPEEYPEENSTFIKQAGIQHFHVGMPGNKEPFVKIPAERILTALRIVLNRENHPILIHCNKGKHRTGCVVGCFRKLQNWSLASIFQEYRDHAEPKARVLDEQFIDLFDERPLLKMAERNGFIPGLTTAVPTQSPIPILSAPEESRQETTREEQG